MLQHLFFITAHQKELLESSNLSSDLTAVRCVLNVSEEAVNFPSDRGRWRTARPLTQQITPSYDLLC